MYTKSERKLANTEIYLVWWQT